MNYIISSREDNKFPVLNSPEGFPKFVKWDALNEEWAQKMHGQDLEKLASRGGLSVEEIVMNIEHRPFHERGPNGVKPLSKSIREPQWARYYKKPPTQEDLDYRDEMLKKLKAIV